MLENGPYPQRLKNRITSPIGHISNGETADFLAHHLNREIIEQIWLCHLSAENNRPEIARTTVMNALQPNGTDTEGPEATLRVTSLPRHSPTNCMDLA